MKKKILLIIKRIVGSIMLIYAVNYLIGFWNVFVPINLYTVLGTYFLGFPGLISFIILFYIVK